MRSKRNQPVFVRQGFAQGAALLCLLMMAFAGLVGPSGIMAWGENQHLLQQDKAELQRLVAQRDQLKNRVALLDPRHADADLAGELLRRDLNVAHPDELVLQIHP